MFQSSTGACASATQTLRGIAKVINMDMYGHILVRIECILFITFFTALLFQIAENSARAHEFRVCTARKSLTPSFEAA